MATSEISRAKTIFVLAIVVGCFAVLWPKVFYPMFQGGVAPEAQHKDESICCGVVFEMDTYLQLVCTHVLHKDLRFARGSVARQALQECRENLLENCQIDIRSPDYRPSQNLTICLRDVYGVDDKKLHHRPNGSVHIPRHMKPERPAHLHPEVMHPGLREKGRTIPPSQHDMRSGRPPIGVRPPMGAGAHVSNTQKGVGVGGGGAMSILMPLYTIGIVVFFVYTVMKVLFKKQPESEEPKIKDFGMDPEHRKFLYEAKINEPEISSRAMADMQRATRGAADSPIPEPADICVDVSEIETKPVTGESEIIPLTSVEKPTLTEEKIYAEKVEVQEVTKSEVESIITETVEAKPTESVVIEAVEEAKPTSPQVQETAVEEIIAKVAENQRVEAAREVAPTPVTDDLVQNVSEPAVTAAEVIKAVETLVEAEQPVALAAAEVAEAAAPGSQEQQKPESQEIVESVPVTATATGETEAPAELEPKAEVELAAGPEGIAPEPTVTAEIKSLSAEMVDEQRAEPAEERAEEPPTFAEAESKELLANESVTEVVPTESVRMAEAEALVAEVESPKQELPELTKLETAPCAAGVETISTDAAIAELAQVPETEVTEANQPGAVPAESTAMVEAEAPVAVESEASSEAPVAEIAHEPAKEPEKATEVEAAPAEAPAAADAEIPVPQGKEQEPEISQAAEPEVPATEQTADSVSREEPTAEEAAEPAAVPEAERPLPEADKPQAGESEDAAVEAANDSVSIVEPIAQEAAATEPSAMTKVEISLPEVETPSAESQEPVEKVVAEEPVPETPAAESEEAPKSETVDSGVVSEANELLPASETEQSSTTVVAGVAEPEDAVSGTGVQALVPVETECKEEQPVEPAAETSVPDVTAKADASVKEEPTTDSTAEKQENEPSSVEKKPTVEENVKVSEEETKDAEGTVTAEVEKEDIAAPTGEDSNSPRTDAQSGTEERGQAEPQAESTTQEIEKPTADVTTDEKIEPEVTSDLVPAAKVEEPKEETGEKEPIEDKKEEQVVSDGDKDKPEAEISTNEENKAENDNVPQAPSHMVSIEEDRLLAIEEMIETDMSFFLDASNIPIAEAIVTPTAAPGVSAKQQGSGEPEEVEETVDKTVVKPYVIHDDGEPGESVEDLLRQAIGEEIKAALAEMETPQSDITEEQLHGKTDTESTVVATEEPVEVIKSEEAETQESEITTQPEVAVCKAPPEWVQELAETTKAETETQKEQAQTAVNERQAESKEAVIAKTEASTAQAEIVTKSEEVSSEAKQDAANSTTQAAISESISSEVFPTEYEFVEKESDAQTDVTNTCPVEASNVETTNQTTPVGEVSHPLGGTPEEGAEQHKDGVSKFGECCSGTCVQDLIQPEVPSYRELHTDSDVQKRLEDLRIQKELEMDLLRKRLEETEAAMERIVAQMGTASDKLLTKEQYDKDLSSTKKRLKEAEEHLEKLKAAKTTDDINELLSAVSSTSVLDTTILPEGDEAKVQVVQSIPFGADAIATSETKISVIGMEVTAQSEDGGKLPRPVTPTKQVAKTNDQGEVTSVLLEALVPTDSHLLVSEAECRAEAVPLEQLDLDESEYEAAPVVLSGKMTLSVLGMELLADPEPPVEHEGDITEADDATMPSEAIDEKEGSVEPGVVEEQIVAEADHQHEAGVGERTTKVRFADTPPQEMIIEEYEEYENENGEHNPEETMTAEDEEDCDSRFKTAVIDTVLEGEHAAEKKDEHPSDEELKQALTDVKKELAAKRGGRADSVDEIMKAVDEARKHSSKPILSESVSADEPLQTFTTQQSTQQTTRISVDPMVYATTEQLATLVLDKPAEHQEIPKTEITEATVEKQVELATNVTETQETTAVPTDDSTRAEAITEPKEEVAEVKVKEIPTENKETEVALEEPIQKTDQSTSLPPTLEIKVTDTVPEFVVTPTEEEKSFEKPEDIPTEEDGEQKVSVSTKFLTNLRQDSLTNKLKDAPLGRSMEITELVIKGPNIEEETEAQVEEEVEETESGEIQQSTRVSSQDIKPETKQVVLKTRSNEEPELQKEIENAMKEESLPASKGSSPDMEDFEVVKTEVLTSRLQPAATDDSITLAAEKPAEEGVRSSSTESSSYEMVGNNNESGNNHSPSPLESTDSTFVPVNEEKKE